MKTQARLKKKRNAASFLHVAKEKRATSFLINAQVETHPSVSAALSVLGAINTPSVCNWLVLFACIFHLHIKMHCVCTTLCNCLFISICKPFQRLIEPIWCQFPFQMSDCVSEEQRDNSHMFLLLCFHPEMWHLEHYTALV